ncbi:hypothetical protein CONLIGDRAFT_341327 [Coniochaeta ligniaria NRRL 30616]|uniref:Uncharacterized protein n=1 Tax=Coniochaeta ligniaria NRRL 30616 TaxID=1408157 RepID=A0A1J7IQ09_9PEZI|nr:hypothetical protein CONLIGDRAFT_341327 [Coniochaeta ligniaria NRRL 30616]
MGKSNTWTLFILFFSSLMVKTHLTYNASHWRQCLSNHGFFILHLVESSIGVLDLIKPISMRSGSTRRLVQRIVVSLNNSDELARHFPQRYRIHLPDGEVAVSSNQ